MTKNALRICRYLLAMAVLGAGSQYLLQKYASGRAQMHAEYLSAKEGPAAYGRLREFGEFRDYASISDVKNATVSGRRTSEWFSFTADSEDIAGLVAARRAAGPYRVMVHGGRMAIAVYRADDWHYVVPLPGSSGRVPGWWQPATLAGAVAYIAKTDNSMKTYIIYQAATKRGYLIVCW